MNAHFIKRVKSVIWIITADFVKRIISVHWELIIKDYYYLINITFPLAERAIQSSTQIQK